MTATLEHPPTETSPEARVDICASIGELGQTCRTKSKFYREALRVVAEHYGSPYASARIAQPAGSLDERVRSETDDIAMWEAVAEEVLLDSQAQNEPIARLYGSKDTSLQAAVLAVPVCELPDRPIGAISVIATCNSASVAKVCLGEFSAIVALIGTQARLIGSSATSSTGDDSALKRAIVKATDFHSLHDLAFAVTNSLKNKFTCEQVVLGRVDRGQIQVLSISGLDDVYPRSPGETYIRQAMEECLDHGDVTCCQADDKWSEDAVATNHCLHKRWHAEIGNAPVASIPLLVGDDCVAVLSMSRSKKLRFGERELTQIRETVAPFAPAIVLVGKADRGLMRHATDSVRECVRWLLAPHSYRRKVIAAVMLVSFAAFCFASVGYQVTVSSEIAPSEIRYFASPFDGTIKACHVEVGDDVENGQLLYEMDTIDLQLQRDRLESDLAVLRLRVNQALASEDAKSAALAGAEMQVIQARLAITRHNLAEAQVRAPYRGTIVFGELSKRIGEVVPLGEPLLELVPEGDWSIDLLVPETVASELQVGAKGRFACNARPGQLLDCEIVRIRPSSEPRQGRNVFIAEATVDGNPTWMRAGMEGTAQIDVGKRRVWWVALHRLIDYARLTLWL